MTIEQMLNDLADGCDQPIAVEILRNGAKEIERLRDKLLKADIRLRKLNTLERNGVDNWEWYGEAMAEEFGGEDEE